MIQRRARLLLLALAASAGTAGCATFTDNGVVAKVGERELTDEQFQELAVAAGGDAAADRATRAQVDSIVPVFLIDSLLREDLAGLDIEVSADGIELPPDPSAYDELQASYQAAVQTFLAQPADVLLDEASREAYAAGPETSGVACAAHILVETEAQAREAIAEIEGGAAFADVATEMSTDTASAINGGQLGCTPVDQFRQQFIPEFVDAALATPIGETSEPVESQFGFHVIRMLSLDDLDPAEVDALVPSIRFASLPDRYGLSVDPRFGEWRSIGALVPVR